MTPRLVGISGAVAGVDVGVEQQPFTIGRHSDNDLCISDPSVSRHHCEIKCDGTACTITDLDSANGTFVNGELLVGRQTLAHGDRVSVGTAVLRLALETEQPPAESGIFTTDFRGAHPTAVMSREEVERSSNELFGQATPLTERASKSLQALLGIGDLLASAASFSNLQEQLMALIAGVVPAERGAIVLTTYDHADPEISCTWDKRGTAAEVVPISRSIVDRVIRDAAAVLAVCPSSDEIASSGSLIAAHVTSVICVPLLMRDVRDRVHGAIYLDTSNMANPFDAGHLRLLSAIAGYAAVALHNSRRIEQLEKENLRLRSHADLRHTMVGDSSIIRDFFARLHKAAQTDATVLLIGESGTGKELAARALHMNSARASGPFEAVNCALLQDTLLESELFGHEKGSFTGASNQKRGRLELADRGTVFLDELGDLPDGPQAMLLRVLQEREFLRVGGIRPIRVDVRVIAATNKDLDEAVKEKRFRQDLFYRLNVICLRLPPLRDRVDDISLLAHYFLQRAAQRNKRAVYGISPQAMAMMMAYSWPGNIRELENAIEYAVVFASTDEILPEDLPDAVHPSMQDAPWVSNYRDGVKAAREQLVLNALRQAGFQYGNAAKVLGIHVNNLHRLIRELNLKDRLPRSEG